MLSKVLLPVDFSESNRIAVEEAKRLRSEMEIKELILLYVIDESVIEELMNGYSLLYSDVDKELSDILKKLAKEAEKKLMLLVEEYKKLFNVEHVSIAVRSGIPHEEICKFAKESDVSLILLPSHGKMSFSKEIFGSTTIRVLKMAERPVLILHSRRGGDNDA